MSQKDVLRTIDTVSEEIIYCPNCRSTHGLRFAPLPNGRIAADCHDCGHQWEFEGMCSRSEYHIG